MFLHVPPPKQLCDLVTGDPLTDANVHDEKGRTLKSLGIAYENKPISMRTWFLRHQSQFFKGYEEFKAARRIEKALAKAEKERGALPVIVEITRDDSDLWKRKLKEQMSGADVFMQWADFVDAISDVTEERPKAELKAVDEPAAPKAG